MLAGLESISDGEIRIGDKVVNKLPPRERDIVGFSTLCPHKGFPLNYVAADKTLNCPGHYSRFDCEKGGMQVPEGRQILSTLTIESIAFLSPKYLDERTTLDVRVRSIAWREARSVR